MSRHTVVVGLAPLHVVLPLRTLSGGKARLGGVVDAEERATLILGMARRTLGVLLGWPGCERLHLVSPDGALLSALVSDAASAGVAERVSTLIQTGEGLGAA